METTNYLKVSIKMNIPFALSDRMLNRVKLINSYWYYLFNVFELENTRHMIISIDLPKYLCTWPCYNKTHVTCAHHLLLLIKKPCERAHLFRHTNLEKKIIFRQTSNVGVLKPTFNFLFYVLKGYSLTYAMWYINADF